VTDKGFWCLEGTAAGAAAFDMANRWKSSLGAHAPQAEIIFSLPRASARFIRRGAHKQTAHLLSSSGFTSLRSWMASSQPDAKGRLGGEAQVENCHPFITPATMVVLSRLILKRHAHAFAANLILCLIMEWDASHVHCLGPNGNSQNGHPRDRAKATTARSGGCVDHNVVRSTFCASDDLMT